MQVLKFGGTSVGTAQRMQNIKTIITDGHPKIVVLSAMSGTTNILVQLGETIQNEDIEQATKLLENLNNWYEDVVNNLFKTTAFKVLGGEYIKTVFNELQVLKHELESDALKNKIVAYGEHLSTHLFNLYLKEQGIASKLLCALDFMKLNANGEPDLKHIRQQLTTLVANNPAEIYITQGFITLNAKGEISNLQRGGSDYTATIIGAALEVNEVQIWTDIDGFHNNDPRIVNTTKPIPKLSYDEAAELAYFGAKILHPQTVLPVRKLNIPIRLKNTMEPDAYGTLITAKAKGKGVKAIAAKDGIIAIKIRSERMLLAYGFLRRVFEIFETYQTPIDMITTSEVAVSLTIDNAKNLNAIIEELKVFSTVEVDNNQTIICLVGNQIASSTETYKLFNLLQTIPTRMISYGGSSSNISLLINEADKIKALNVLHQLIFEPLVENLIPGRLT